MPFTKDFVIFVFLFRKFYRGRKGERKQSPKRPAASENDASCAHSPGTLCCLALCCVAQCDSVAENKGFGFAAVTQSAASRSL